MNLSQALKEKNRLAGELVRQQQILQRENSRRSDATSKVDREQVWNKIIEISTSLGELKGRITVANIGVYPMLEGMSELKARISYLNSLSVREGEELVFIGRDQEKMSYTWNSLINQEKRDILIGELQLQINTLQDKIDIYNAVTQL
jgi:hypothetical protein